MALFREGPAGQGGGAYLFSAGFTPTDSEAMAVTVSASSFSHFWASTRECPTVEQRRGRERQYWPGAREAAVTGTYRVFRGSHTSPAPLKAPLSGGQRSRCTQAHKHGHPSPPGGGGTWNGGGPGVMVVGCVSGASPRTLGAACVKGASRARPLRWGGPREPLCVCLHTGALSREAGGGPVSAQGAQVSVGDLARRPPLAGSC